MSSVTIDCFCLRGQLGNLKALRDYQLNHLWVSDIILSHVWRCEHPLFLWTLSLQETESVIVLKHTQPAQGLEVATGSQEGSQTSGTSIPCWKCKLLKQKKERRGCISIRLSSDYRSRPGMGIFNKPSWIPCTHPCLRICVINAGLSDKEKITGRK